MSKNLELSLNREEPETLAPNSFTLGFFLFAGVILPTAALLVELTWRICAEHLFDPIPTWWHILLVAFVPVTNFQTWFAFRKGSVVRPWWMSFANGVTIFISLFYALIFAPFIPIAVIAILFFFIGLLPLAPLLSSISTIIIRVKMGRLYPVGTANSLQWKALAAAFMFVVATLGFSEMNFTITRLGIVKANSSDLRTQDQGVALLRKYGDTDYLLRLSYDGSAVVSTNLFLKLLAGNEIGEDKNSSLSKQAQKAYYRLTGKSYRLAPTPRTIRNWERVENWDNLDPTGNFRINKNLSLSYSQIDGSVDADATLGYLEWTLVFKNDSSGMQEAISQIQLPPGAVVSRLTLWINGEEREAAFAKSAKVIEAYNTVTARRLDPALVTLTGKDRIQLKCFPVPANGEMKVRIGITVPLILENATTGFIAMPYFQDRNYEVLAEHSVWVESKGKLEIGNPAFRQEARDGIFGVRGRLSNDQLVEIGSPIKVERSPNVTRVWAKDPHNKDISVVQEISQSFRPSPSRLIFVIDPSIQLAEFQTQIAEAIRKLPSEFPSALVLSGGNGLNSEMVAPAFFEGTSEDVANRIGAAKFDGGPDSVPAIEAAWELAHSAPGSPIIWIHGPQPIEFDSPARLTQLWTRRPTEVPIYSLQIGTGRNTVERVLNESDAVSTILRFGSPGEDLGRLFGKLFDHNASFEAIRTTTDGLSKTDLGSAKETSQHLVRLWAKDESLRLLKAGDEPKAIDIAVRNQLVTRVSGAVVLETKEQYDQFGLKPVDPSTVPTIPEPEEYLLFAIVLLILIYFVRRYRRIPLRTA